MNTQRISTTNGLKFCIMLCFIFLIHQQVNAQTWSLQAGNNLTTYEFTNSSGQVIDNLKGGSGNHIGLQFHHNLVDTAPQSIKSSPQTRSYNQLPLLSKFLSKVDWGLGIQYNQYNAVGDVLHQLFSYQTDYLGLRPIIQFKQALFKGLQLNLSTFLMLNHLVHGNQAVGNQYFNLTQDKQFNSLHFMRGFQFGIQVGNIDNVSFSLSYQHALQISGGESQGTRLVMIPESIVFGIHYQAKNK